MVALLRLLLEPILCTLCSGPRERPATIHDHDFVNREINIELDGRENALIRLREGPLTDSGEVAGGHQDAVGGVQGED